MECGCWSNFGGYWKEISVLRGATEWIFWSIYSACFSLDFLANKSSRHNISIFNSAYISPIPGHDKQEYEGKSSLQG